MRLDCIQYMMKYVSHSFAYSRAKKKSFKLVSLIINLYCMLTFL